MAWTKLAKPAFILGNFVRGFIQGSVDEIVETFTLLKEAISIYNTQ